MFSISIEHLSGSKSVPPVGRPGSECQQSGLNAIFAGF